MSNMAAAAILTRIRAVGGEEAIINIVPINSNEVRLNNEFTVSCLANAPCSHKERAQTL